MTTEDVFITVMDFPHNIHAFTKPIMDGAFTVFLNARDCFEQQEKLKRHEFELIERGDCDKLPILYDMMEYAKHG